MKDFKLTEKEVIAEVQELKESFLICRDLGHAWKSNGPITEEQFENGKFFLRVLTCRSCKTKRMDVLNRHGEVVKRQYRHAKNYLIPGGGHLTNRRSYFRHEILKRAGLL